MCSSGMVLLTTEIHRHIARFTRQYKERLRSRTLFQFSKPVSPHIAAREKEKDVSIYFSDQRTSISWLLPLELV